MSQPATSRLERIALAIIIPGYIFMVLLFGSLSWTMADERRRVEAGPTMGEVSYSIASPAGTIACRDEIELGPDDLGFHQGQVIQIVAGDHCGQAVSIKKRLMPLSYGLLTIFAALFPVAHYIWRRRKQKLAERSPTGSS